MSFSLFTHIVLTSSFFLYTYNSSNCFGGAASVVDILIWEFSIMPRFFKLFLHLQFFFPSCLPHYKER